MALARAGVTGLSVLWAASACLEGATRACENEVARTSAARRVVIRESGERKDVSVTAEARGAAELPAVAPALQSALSRYIAGKRWDGLDVDRLVGDTPAPPRFAGDYDHP